MAAQCYFPNGDLATDDRSPCDPSAKVSSCCPNQSICIDNGLCLGPYGGYSRDSCTDSTWGEECCQYCKTTETNGPASLMSCPVETTALFICSETPDLDTCNTKGFHVDRFKIHIRDGQLNSTFEVAQDSLSSVCSSNAAETMATTAAATTAPTAASISGQCESSQSGYSAGSMAGVGLGIGLPLLIALVAALFLLWRERKYKAGPQSNPTPAYVPPADHKSPAGTYLQQPAQPGNGGFGRRMGEFPAGQSYEQSHELDSYPRVREHSPLTQQNFHNG